MVDFAKKYLSAHTPETLKEDQDEDLHYFGGRNIFCNLDAVSVEWQTNLPQDFVRIDGFVGMHKTIFKGCHSKDEIKEQIDILIRQTLLRKHHKCSEPKTITEVEGAEVENTEIDLDL